MDTLPKCHVRRPRSMLWRDDTFIQGNVWRAWWDTCAPPSMPAVYWLLPNFTIFECFQCGEYINDPLSISKYVGRLGMNYFRLRSCSSLVRVVNVTNQKKPRRSSVRPVVQSIPTSTKPIFKAGCHLSILPLWVC